MIISHQFVAADHWVVGRKGPACRTGLPTRPDGSGEPSYKGLKSPPLALGVKMDLESIR